MTSISPFSEETKEGIKSIREGHCTFCMRYLSQGDPRECPPSWMLQQFFSWAVKAGFVKESNSIPDDVNGILLCANCREQYFSPKDAIFSLPVQLMRYHASLNQKFDNLPPFQVLEALDRHPELFRVMPFSDFYSATFGNFGTGEAAKQ